MMATSPEIRCCGCGAIVPDVQHPTHAYIGASPGCWQIYGEILAREYSDSRYLPVHPLTVDAYAVQHPGNPSPQSIQSVAVHLISLHSILEREIDLQASARVRQQATQHKASFEWLEPPSERGSITILDVHAAHTPEEHLARVYQWAMTVWAAWAEHHATIRQWATLSFP